MPKFLKRKLKRRYKGKNHFYPRFVLEIPTKLNNKIQAFLDRTFDIEISTSENTTQEMLIISLITKKRQPTAAPAKE